ncbi:uncharacterized protein EDB91DRAFT_1349596 [Suillus paluster]|uniref:uncharacterized protein n=1 Tax=Suillus paluster TaxID=48578 RepID=UPI001B8781A5|nr:uncharacterized protein EDB91DRAFT_1349596 [Suillus paluster]KAG1730710.1 hypothetical protein EDB91DRAFT_1349596 [Suillus paluster]
MTLASSEEYNELYFRFSVASTAVIIYDYGLGFTREVELIWCQRWKPTTVLYIIARYLGLAIAIVQIWEAPGILLSNTVSGIVGRSWSWGMFALACTMYAIMAFRVFAMYLRSKKMGIFIIICFLAASASRGIMDGLALVLTSGSTSEQNILSGTGVCATSRALAIPFLDGIPSICIELLFLLLAARVLVRHILEMQSLRQNRGFGNGDDDCIAIIRDHVQHFLCYLILNIMQVAAISMNDDTDGSRWYRSIAIFFVTIQQCVLVPRLVISIREYYSQLDYMRDGATNSDLGIMSFAYNSDT